MLNLLSDQPRFAQCKGLDAGSFIRRASRKPSNTAKYLQSSRHRSSLIRSLSSSISRSSAPNSLLSSCRASSMACFSFLMVFTIPARTSRASGDLSIPKMVSFRWFGACRSAAAESAKPCRIHLCDGDSPIVMKCERSLLSVSRPHDPSGRLLLLCTGTVNIKYVEQTGTRPYPCGPKWSTRSDGKAQRTRRRAGSRPLRLAPVSAGRPLLHFLSTGARCVCASYTIPLIRIRGDTPCYL